jgi:hypothetical protein
MSDKKITPREAALAVLKKAEELYKSSTLAKAESKHDRCVKDVERNTPGVKNAHAVCVAEGVKPAKWGKSEKPIKKDGNITLSPSVGSAISSGFNGATAMGSGVAKSDEAGNNPDSKADAELGEKVEQDVHQHEAHNEDPAHEAPMKGHIKLAKFMGAMEQKRGTRAK